MTQTFSPNTSTIDNKYFFVRRCAKCKGVLYGYMSNTDHYCLCNIQSTTNPKIG
jgi:hypothetical protein